MRYFYSKARSFFALPEVNNPRRSIECNSVILLDSSVTDSDSSDRYVGPSISLERRDAQGLVPCAICYPLSLLYHAASRVVSQGDQCATPLYRVLTPLPFDAHRLQRWHTQKNELQRMDMGGHAIRR